MESVSARSAELGVGVWPTCPEAGVRDSLLPERATLASGLPARVTAGAPSA